MDDKGRGAADRLVWWSMTVSLLGLVAVLFLFFFSSASSQAQTDAPAQVALQAGTSDVLPDRVSVTSWTSLQVVYRVGPGGIQEGGGIQIQFPKSWHAWTPVARVPQTADPAASYYVTATVSTHDGGGRVGLAVANTAIDGRQDRLDWTTTITLAGMTLSAGDTITYTFGDTSGGGAGVLANATAMTEYVRVAEDPEGDGSFVELPDLPRLTVAAGPVGRVAAYAPGEVEAGTSFRLLLSAQDLWTNVAEAYTGTIHLTATDPLADLPADYTFVPADGSRKVFTVTLHWAATQRIGVVEQGPAARGRMSNPIQVHEGAPALNVYWGDLHSHTEFSKDGVGPLSQALTQARDVFGLDFYAVTDHVDYPATGLTDAEWQETQALVAAWHEPGRFVPILAYEWSRPTPYGHHNVYFEGDRGPLCYLDACSTLEALWASLAGEKAFTIPHHTGIRWGTATHTVDWSTNGPALRPAIEIYSGHGQSELYDPVDPLSYEQRRPGAAESVDGPHYARDAWAAGHRIGVVAGSDQHDPRPGMPWNGLTAVYAPELSRTALFDAVRARHTYATTGERILIEFRLGEAMMGDEVLLSVREAPVLDVTVVGTAEIEWVELVRFDGVAYTSVYSVVPESGGDKLQVTFRYTDTTSTADGLYYVRMQQVDPNKPDRPARAWSSPIWVDRPSSFYVPIVWRGPRS